MEFKALFLSAEATPREAKALQETLCPKIMIRPFKKKITTIAGVDVSYQRFAEEAFCAVVVLDARDLSIIETTHGRGVMHFPYVPGLLSFREGPIVLAAWKRLKTRPDVVVFDGQGLAHPRRFGLACHMGLAFNVPSIGCAKSLLVGEHKRLGIKRGSKAPLLYDGEVVGAALRTKTNVNPVYVSPGHKMDIESAVRILFACDGGYRVPEPTRQAHRAVNAYRREMSGEERVQDPL